MKKISKNEAASYCCEASTVVDVENLVKDSTSIRKIEKNEAASYCCEASEEVDIQKLIPNK